MWPIDGSHAGEDGTREFHVIRVCQCCALNPGRIKFKCKRQASRQKLTNVCHNSFKVFAGSHTSIDFNDTFIRHDVDTGAAADLSDAQSRTSAQRMGLDGLNQVFRVLLQERTPVWTFGKSHSRPESDLNCDTLFLSCGF